MADFPSPVSETLKACPFCGVTNAELEFGPEHRHWPAVRCNECGTLGPSIKLDHNEAIALWNTRGHAQRSTEQAKAYVERAIASYIGDPADNQFQRGFLAALEVVRDEAFTISDTSTDRPVSFCSRCSGRDPDCYICGASRSSPTCEEK